MYRNNNIVAVEGNLETLLSKGQIPIIDLGHCGGTDGCVVKSVVNRVATQLKKALSEKGLAFIVNHGIPEEELKIAWEYLDDFCKLPTDVKELYIRKGDDNHGYIKPGLEKFDGKTPELRHAFNICTLSVANLPEEPLPGFREHIADLATRFKSLTSLILQALAVSLELPSNYFLEKHTNMLSGNHDNETTLRLLYYPPIIEDDNKCELTKGRCKYSYQRCTMDRPDLGIIEDSKKDDEDGAIKDILKNGGAMTRCGAHCDYGTFTLLSQDSEGGLEVQLPESERWKRVGHLPGAIFINTGEILAHWTQNKYPALKHRVIIPEQTCVRNRGRHSIAFFCHPDNITEIVPIDMQTSEEACDTCDTSKITKKKSIKVATNKIMTAYQMVQRRFKQTYNS